MSDDYGLSDPAMKLVRCVIPLYRGFPGLDGDPTPLPDENTIQRFRHLPEAHGLTAQMFMLVKDPIPELGSE